jgi:hypothetical protein
MHGETGALKGYGRERHHAEISGAFRVSTPEGQKSCAATRNETGGPAFAEPPGITGFFEVFRPAK